MKLKDRSLYIWLHKDDTVEWQGKNLKPSELCLFAAILQEHALKMMDGKVDHE